ncbi:MAG: cytochrome c family protein [Dongiaceae bacterium]
MASSLEFNKIAGAVLLAGLVAMACGLAANVLVGTGEHEGGAEMAANAPEGGGAAPAPPAIEPVSGLLASANVAEGEKIAQKCAQCHSFGKGEPAKIGPNLWGIVDNKHGHQEGYSYSKAIASIDKPWTYEELNHFIYSPKAYAPGTKMTFPGLPKVQERADVIAWLRTLADTPAPLPDQAAIDAAKKAFDDAAKPAAATAEPATKTAAAPAAGAQSAAAPATGGEAAPAAAAGGQEAAPAAAESLGALLAKADVAKGQKATAVCGACHSFDKGGPNKVGPNLWNVVGGPHAHKEDYGYSDAMKALHDKPWTFEALDAFLTAPQKDIPGTKMTFPGIKKAEQRADVIAYLRSLSDSPQPLPAP